MLISLNISAIKDTHPKKHLKIKLQGLRKIQIWTFGLLVHQTNSFLRGSKTGTNFQKK